MSRPRADGLAITAVLFAFFLAHNLYRDRSGQLDVSGEKIGISQAIFSQAAADADPAGEADGITGEPAQTPAEEGFALDQQAIEMPYPEYILTQGVHGFEYGHLAIDISAGKGAQINSPINGLVTASFADPVGSTILIIENDRWIVTLVHGLFEVSAGDFVRLGQALGRESNQGNTVDMEGNSCRGRDCGYHTHINIFDKQAGINIDPLLLFPLQD